MDTPRITRDPTQDLVPDYNTDPDWDDFVNSCVTDDRNRDDIVKGLIDSWTARHAKTIQAWEAQLEVDREEEKRLAELRAQTAEHVQREAEKEKAEEEKKKFKPPPMDQMASIPTHSQASPLPFALEKMRKYEFVELWYFGMDGCEEARINSLAESTTGYGFAAAGDDATIAALRPLSTLTKSPKAIPDERLSFTHLSIAKTLYIHTMNEVGWPVEYIKAWAHFYTILENHHFRRIEPHGEQVLVKYQAHMRRDWYRLLLAKKPVFNVALINEDLVSKLEDDILRQMRLDSMTTVRFFLFLFISMNHLLTMSFIILSSMIFSVHMNNAHTCIRIRIRINTHINIAQMFFHNSHTWFHTHAGGCWDVASQGSLSRSATFNT
ncbi:hypothetical protein BDP27DRAFT_1494264 [Rhodocollybia butyracea]|uniref:Uncharacterized protein n=1 Tax=Rhodocollybia butyracea TaxID=206335 RepID=A0A9P5PB66_9AGAR|nr:hypothetical protein BDP27DRAFT_1494264 [Rhodocollybia butyracea]